MVARNTSTGVGASESFHQEASAAEEARIAFEARCADVGSRQWDGARQIVGRLRGGSLQRLELTELRRGAAGKMLQYLRIVGGHERRRMGTGGKPCHDPEAAMPTKLHGQLELSAVSEGALAGAVLDGSGRWAEKKARANPGR